MGDHRASIKIEMEAHGKTYKQDWLINWSPDDSTGCDPRVTEWFEECWRDAYARYNADLEEYFREASEKHERETELAELKRLKTKYESPSTEESSAEGIGLAWRAGPDEIEN